jgi:hypothetical protein
MNRPAAFALVLVSSIFATFLGGCASTAPQGAHAIVGFGVQGAPKAERSIERPSRMEPPPYKAGR